MAVRAPKKPSSGEKIMMAVVKAAELFKRRSSAFIKKPGLSFSQYTVLRVLNSTENGKKVIDGVGQAMLSSAPNLTGIAKRLGKGGFITRQVLERDAYMEGVWFKALICAILVVAYLALLHGSLSAEAKPDDTDLSGLALPSGLRGDELLLAEDGQPTAAIVIGRTSGQPIREAAEALQQFVERMTGAKLPLVDDRAKGLPDVVVCVGPSVLTGLVELY